MALLFPGVFIRRERIRRNWSQEGLCRGICAVSYLSKIEQGKAEASPELLGMLFARLKLPWYDDEATGAMAESFIKRCYEAVFSCDKGAMALLRRELGDRKAHIFSSPYALDGAILHGLLANPYKPADKELEPFFDRRQLALQRLMQGRREEAMRLYPCAWISLMTGIELYEEGRSEAEALEYLRRAYDMAAEEGYVRIMLLARLYMGNCYCNKIDIKNMNEQYRIAERLAQALEEDEVLRDIQYNRASASLEAGDYKGAYAYFAEVEQPTMMDLHKLAICCEKAGRLEEALAALDQAAGMESEYPNLQLSRQMCSLVRFRMEHEDYLQRSEYKELLFCIFSQCCSEMPIGYASFHLPWVLEWYTANRQYRAAYELVQNFPLKLPIKED